VFIATQPSVFPHASIGRGSAVRIGAVVHIRTRLLSGSSVPIGWIAVADPLTLYTPAEHEAVLAHLRRLDFSATVFGIAARQNLTHMSAVTERYARALATHRDDPELVVDPASGSTP
jgi:carbonic anhydrase/acetyltransferase-like protein (isoleucine patch superfamily)